MTLNQKNIVICLDGTGNQIEDNLSNVLKLYRALEKSEEQLVFYDQGVGTLGQVLTWGNTWQKMKNLLGLAFGLGLDKNVLQAYEFIVRHYEEHEVDGTTRRDQIFIFGFSRGAHTARVLAGLLYHVGIIRPEQIHLSGAALTAYKQFRPSVDDVSDNEAEYEGAGANFRRVAATRYASVQFLGVWDTVSSVFVPNAHGIWPPIVREKLPYTQENPAVRTFRHAISVDERRRMFRVDHWRRDQIFKPNTHSQGDPELQDASEVWFAGFHSDVGGGHARRDSGLSQFPLIWMLEEAKHSGLKISQRMADYVSGQRLWSSTTKHKYPEPDVRSPDHASAKGLWRFLEYIPKSVRFREWPARKQFLGFYLPMSEPRPLPEGAVPHPSLLKRIRVVSDYKPENVPIEVWSDIDDC
ncbi:MAG: DUF2235 domain-containing protein [Hyphomicrobiaceae bacterium]